MIKNLIHNVLLASACALLLTACNGFFEGEGDCTVHYKLRFRYDYNMKYADAFAHEVKSVRVYAFAPDGTLAWSGTESGARLAEEGFEMDMPLDPGEYKIVAWCGADNNPGAEHFTIAGGGEVAAPADLTCRLERKSDAAGTPYHDENLHPLFHGTLAVELPDMGYEGGTHTVTMPLVKDTNQIRVILQHMSGENVDVADFDFKIIADNGHMEHTNELIPDEEIHYRAWGRFSGEAGVEVNDPGSRSRTVTQVQVARADLTIPRLTVGQRQRTMLHITRTSDGSTVAKIPLVDYALLVKDLDSAGSPIHDDQEYLDRQDQYSMMFFLDDGGNWLSSVICVNSWRLVLQNVVL